MDCSPPGSSVHGIFQARILEWVTMPFFRGSSWPRDWTHFSQYGVYHFKFSFVHLHTYVYRRKHTVLFSMSVCVCLVVSNFFVILWTIACQAPLSIRFSRQECWSGLPCPTPGDLPELGIEPTSLAFPVLAGEFFTTSATWEQVSKPGLHPKPELVALNWILWHHILTTPGTTKSVPWGLLRKTPQLCAGEGLF